MDVMKRSPSGDEPKTNPYLVGNRPRLLPSFVCYVDLLGWKAACLRAFAHGTSESFITYIREQIYETYSHVREIQQVGHRDSRMFEIKTFTDNIVLALPNRNNEFQAGDLISLLELAAAVQLQMLTIGFPTRGGIARGPHFMDEDFAFGEALIEAVEFDESVRHAAEVDFGTRCCSDSTECGIRIEIPVRHTRQRRSVRRELSRCVV
jgi:hypothetical protein